MLGVTGGCVNSHDAISFIIIGVCKSNRLIGDIVNLRVHAVVANAPKVGKKSFSIVNNKHLHVEYVPKRLREKSMRHPWFCN